MMHVFYEDGAYEVWLDTEVSDKDGICLGADKNRYQAIEQAIGELTEAMNQCRDLEKEPEE